MFTERLAISLAYSCFGFVGVFPTRKFRISFVGRESPIKWNPKFTFAEKPAFSSAYSSFSWFPPPWLKQHLRAAAFPFCVSWLWMVQFDVLPSLFPGKPGDKSSPSGPWVGNCLKRSCSRSGADKKWLLFDFAKYVLFCSLLMILVFFYQNAGNPKLLWNT